MFRFTEEQTRLPKITLPPEIPVVLASGSPRRRELCTRMGLTFSVHPADCDEHYDSALSPLAAVELLSCRKCETVVAEAGTDTLVIASDTIVELDGAALGKPRDEKEAAKMLCRLSGHRHFVRTGLAVAYGGRMLHTADTAAVTFRPLSDEEIVAYVRTGEPMDKAGAYAVQGRGGAFVVTVDGRWDTIVGLCCMKVAELIGTLLPSAVIEGAD